MVVGAGCFAFLFMQEAACWVYLAGAMLFAYIQVGQTYDGPNLTIRRLKRIMTLADIVFVLAGLLMVDYVHKFLLDAFSDSITYYNIIYNKWVVLLLVAAILEMYTMHRISSELAKENREEGAEQK